MALAVINHGYVESTVIFIISRLKRPQPQMVAIDLVV
ncbi:hypothetical protein CCACVL1_23513 [Corchorus capsularis]|uniref:Uncharacterized protein n=1 Tax=Corchorus capsularis TaxID=210143 RepID=A0A1R3GTK3_COCAP|nr:hypothetical protein CCACVL1_23513 [Corchorus capsularis]